MPLVGGVALVRRDEGRSARALPALPALPRDAGRRADQLDGLLLGRVARLVETRSLQLALPRLAEGVQEAFEGSYSADDQQAVEEGRGASGGATTRAGPTRPQARHLLSRTFPSRGQRTLALPGLSL